MTGRKGFLLGLAAGVLFGALGTVIVFRSDRGPSGKQAKAILDTRVIQMTPEQFVRRCGKLVSDKRVDVGSAAMEKYYAMSPDIIRRVTVGMTLPDGEQKNVTAKFGIVTRRKGEVNWVLSQVGGYTPDTGPLGGLSTIEELYPCTTKP